MKDSIQNIKTLKIILLLSLDIVIMALTYYFTNLVFSVSSLHIDPEFPKYIPLLVGIKLLVYGIFGLYSEKSKGIAFEITGVIMANLIVYLTLRFGIKTQVSTYLILIAVTIDIVTETISRSIAFNVYDNQPIVVNELDKESKEKLEEIDDLKQSLLEQIETQGNKKQENAQMLSRLQNVETKLQEKESRLNDIEESLSKKESSIQQQLAEIKKEKEENKRQRIEASKAQKKATGKIINTAMEEIIEMRASLDQRAKEVDLKEHDLMMKMHDFKDREIELLKYNAHKSKLNLSDDELIKATEEKISNRTIKGINIDEIPDVKVNKANNNKDLFDLLDNSPLLNKDRKKAFEEEIKNSQKTTSTYFKKKKDIQDSDIKENPKSKQDISSISKEPTNGKIEISSKSKKEPKPATKKGKVTLEKKDKKPEATIVGTPIVEKTDSLTEEERKIINMMKSNSDLKESKENSDKDMDFIFSEKEFEKINEMLDEL